MKTRVLIVDDEEAYTRNLKLILELKGNYEVRYENWGGPAAETARKFKPDVVLLDVRMVPMDGGEVAAQFKADPELKDCPIIFHTAAVKWDRVKEHGGVISGYPFLPKPATIAEIIAAIEEQIGKH